MLRYELYSMIHVMRFKDENATELFLGLRISAASFSVLAAKHI